VRPHRGGIVLTLGIVSLIGWILLPCLGVLAPVGLVGLFTLAISAWILGTRDLRAIRAGGADASGRQILESGRLCGILATCACLLLGAYALGSTPLTVQGGSSSSNEEGQRRTKIHHARSGDQQGKPVTEFEYDEVQLPNGDWVRHGPAIRWSRAGQKLEEGGYVDGEREGPWTFWNDDGRIDPARTGYYHEGARVGDDPPADPLRSDPDR